MKFVQDNCRCLIGCGDGKLYIYEVHSAHLLQTLTTHSDMITAIIPSGEYFVLTSGGNKMVVWNFYSRRTNGKTDQMYVNVVETGGALTVAGGQPRVSSRPPSKKKKKIDNHREPITCVAVSRDGNFAVSGSRDFLVKIWQLSSGETHTTLDGHTGAVTCVDFAPNGLFAVSGSEDKTLRVWGLTLGLIVFTFKEHQAAIVACKVSNDSRKILSVDQTGVHRLWAADGGNQLVVTNKPINNVSMHANMVFAIAGKNDNW